MKAVVVALLLISTAALADSDEDFARHVDAARSEFAAGRYDDALSDLESARRIRALPEIDHNLALCLDRLGRRDEALSAYRRYLDSRPSDAAEVRTRIAQLEGTAPSPAPEVAPSPAPALIVAAPPPPSPSRRRAAIAVAVSVGVAIVAAIAIGVGVGLRPMPTNTSSTFGVQRVTP